jgi:CheY-like chemotaxis protein
VALIDIGLPEMDGYELGRRLRQQSDANAPVQLVAITGYGRESDVRRSRDAGFVRHVVKPIALSAIGELLAGMARIDEGPVPRDLRRAADHG